MNYIPSYASEIYYYLNARKIFEKFFPDKTVKVLSLGCGCGPDLMAIIKYQEKINPKLTFTYKGIDLSPLWKDIRNTYPSASFVERDLTLGFSLKGYDVIFLVKIFSTLYKNKVHQPFIDILRKKINEEMSDNAILIYNDINSCYMGRDVFDVSVKDLFSKVGYYYFPVNGAHTESRYRALSQNGNIFKIPDGLSINPLREIRNTVFFEYHK